MELLRKQYYDSPEIAVNSALEFFRFRTELKEKLNDHPHYFWLWNWDYEYDWRTTAPGLRKPGETWYEITAFPADQWIGSSSFREQLYRVVVSESQSQPGKFYISRCFEGFLNSTSSTWCVLVTYENLF